MHSLLKLLNNGLLPFIGREEERDRLLAFCRESGEVGGLRSCVIVGPAGMGKTRLIDETIDALGEGVLTLRIRLYADSSLALGAMLSEALERTGRHPSSKSGDRDFGPVVRELREAARLRPVVVIIEDLHLLSGEPINDFLRLLEGVAEEPISLLVTTRPGDHASLDPLGRWPVQRLELEGIDQVAIDRLWHDLFEQEGDPVMSDVLLRHTLGTPLALRNALASALRSGTYAYVEEEREWRLMVPIERFEEDLQGDVSRLLRGITAFLTDEERRSALLLAGLGETFSFAAAREILGSRAGHFDSLLHKRVVVPIHTVHPISGEPTPGEYAGFSHTLLHHNLAGEQHPRVESILRVIAARLPLTSTLPFQRLIEADPVAGLDARLIVDVVEKIVADALQLDRTSDWSLSPILLQSAERLFELYPESWGEARRREDLLLLSVRLRIDRRSNHTEEYHRLVTRMTALVMDDDLPEELLEYRLISYAYRYQALRRARCTGGYAELFDEVEDLITKYPALRRTRGYLDFLERAGRSTTIEEDNEMIHRVEASLERLLAEEGLDPDFREEALRRIAPLILWIFYGSEQLQRKLRLLDELEEIVGDQITFQTRKMAMLDGLGRSIEAHAIADRLLPRLRAQGLVRDLIQTRLFRLYASLGLGKSYEAAIRELEEIEEEAPGEIRSAMYRSVGVRFSQLLLLRGEKKEATDVIDRYLGGETGLLTPEDHLVLAEESEEIVRVLRKNREYVDRVFGSPIIAGAIGEMVDLQEILGALDDLLARPLLLRNSVLVYGQAIRLVGSIPDIGKDPGVNEKVVEIFEKVLNWLVERKLFSYMVPVLEEGKNYLPKKRLSWWKDRISEAEESWLAEGGFPGERRLLVSMLGEIAVTRGTGEPVRVRGGRLRTLLGLFAAAPLLRTPLKIEEFRYIASDREEDPERARKTTAMGLLRLRELLGESAIDQEEEVPRLDPRVVTIDLHEALELLESVRTNLREGQLLRSSAECRRALEVLGGETPFPTLYDDFFEAARGELEILVRSVVLDVSGALRDAGEVDAAGELLCAACALLEGDEGVREEYCDLLRETGRLAEAARLEMNLSST